MPVRLNLTPETERVLRERAAQNGQTLEALLEAMAEQEARSRNGASSKAFVTPDDFEQGLNELAEGLPSLPQLPADLSRSDIYGEHA